MVSTQSVEDQLKRIGYKLGWNRPETGELATILLPDEEIFECVNGWYEGGFALLCATNIRVLLIDKKPFKFLTVEDVRFDTINQIDYSHRMMNASISITAGMKALKFRSYNQPRLRKLITHVQHRMAELKHGQHLEDESKNQSFGDQLREYLMSQFDQQQMMKLRSLAIPKPISQIMEGELVDKQQAEPEVQRTQDIESAGIDPSSFVSGVTSDELYEDGVKEVFGKYQAEPTSPVNTATVDDGSYDPLATSVSQSSSRIFDTNPLKIATSKLPMILRSKKRQAPTLNSAV